MDRTLGLRNALVGVGSANVTGNAWSGPYQGAFSAMGAGGQYITAFPAYDLVVVHKVNIDVDPHRNLTEPTYMTILGMVLDAKCDKKCY